MRVTCPECRGLADKTYDPTLFKRIKYSHCGYEDLAEVFGTDISEIEEMLKLRCEESGGTGNTFMQKENTRGAVT